LGQNGPNGVYRKIEAAEVDTITTMETERLDPNQCTEQAFYRTLREVVGGALTRYDAASERIFNDREHKNYINNYADLTDARRDIDWAIEAYIKLMGTKLCGEAMRQGKYLVTRPSDATAETADL
jgi:hypothetical protein